MAKLVHAMMCSRITVVVRGVPETYKKANIEWRKSIAVNQQATCILLHLT